MPAVRPHAGPRSAFEEGPDPVLTATADAQVQQRPRPASEPVELSPIWGLTRGDRGLLMLSLVVMAALLSAHVWRDRERQFTQVPVIHPRGEYQFRVAMNDATWVEWAQLEGIGETLARRIVADRQQRGPFHSPDDLLRVKGIGPKTLQKLRPFIRVDTDEQR